MEDRQLLCATIVCVDGCLDVSKLALGREIAEWTSTSNKNACACRSSVRLLAVGDAGEMGGV
jgi:hypothetical protein